MTIEDQTSTPSSDLLARGATGESLLEPGGELDEIALAGSRDLEFTVEAKTQRQLVTRRFFRHRLAMISLTVLMAIVLVAFVGLPIYGKSPTDPGLVENGGRPTLDAIPWIDGDGFAWGSAPLGQDNIGRDYLAVTLRGAQQSLLIAGVAGLLATFIGTVIGGLAGYYRGWLDATLMRIVDVLFTIPLLIVAIVISRNVESDSFYVIAIVIALTSWYTTSRVIRAEFMSLREKEFVEAAQAMGATNARIMWKHILPNVVGSVIVTATLLISAAILVETALAYLGFGSGVSLGKQVSDYQTAFNTRPWLFWWPGMFIVTIALCINFIGDGLRDAFDPKQTRVRQ